MDIRAIRIRANEGQVFAGRRYHCTCHRDVFGGSLGNGCVIACIACHLDGRPIFGLRCKGIHNRLRGQKNRITLRGMEGIVVTIHRTGLPSPQIRKGTKDFFVGPVVPHERFRVMRRRCPSVPRCRISNGEIGVPTT